MSVASKERLERFAKVVRQNKDLSNPELADLLNQKPSTVRRYKRACRKKGINLEEASYDIPVPVRQKIATIDEGDVTNLEDEETVLDELEEIVAEYGSKLQELDVEQEEVTYNVQTDWFPIVGLSDLHIGHKNTDYDYINKLFDFVRDYSRVHCFVNGDLIENWVRAAPAGGGWDETIPPKYQRKLAQHKLKIIKDKILFLIEGNHEWRSTKQGEEPMLKIIAEDMGIPYLGPGGRLNINLNDIEYKLHARHQYRYESSFNPCHACGRLNEQLDSEADIVAIGHKHVPNVESRYKAGKWRLYIRYGAALPTTFYERQKGYQKTPLVAPTILLNGKVKAMEGLKRLETVKGFLDCQ